MRFSFHPQPPLSASHTRRHLRTRRHHTARLNTTQRLHTLLLRLPRQCRRYHYRVCSHSSLAVQACHSAGIGIKSTRCLMQPPCSRPDILDLSTSARALAPLGLHQITLTRYARSAADMKSACKYQLYQHLHREFIESTLATQDTTLQHLWE